MNNEMFEGDFCGNPVLGTLSFIADDVDALDVEVFHVALDQLTKKTFPRKYEVVSVQVTGRDYNGKIYSILKCDKIFDDADIKNFKSSDEF